MSSKNAAAARRDEIIAENINFMYGRSKENAAADSDKRSFVKSNKFLDPFDTINDFTGTNTFLSPSFATDVFLSGETEPYPSYEHALQASRFSLIEERDKIRNTPLIRDVKKMTPKFKSNKGELWKQECLSTAERLLRDKFIRNKELTNLLKATGKKSLVYANTYGEHFWGSPVDNPSRGQNHLGSLLEKIRNDIIKGEDIDLWLTTQIKIVGSNEVDIKLQVEKNGEVISDDCQVFERRPKLFLGKAESNDIVTAHSSTSRTHAALVIGTLQGAAGVRTYIVDFLSSNGTSIDGTRIRPYIFTPLPQESLVTVGASSRSYRFLVDTDRNRKAKELLYNRMANPDILAAKAEELNNENTVFVGNIPFEAAEADVKEFFSICGAIVSVIMPKDKEKDGQHRGIAFVTFASSAGLLQALSRGGDDLMGRNIAVKRREGKANPAASSVSKPAIAAQKQSYYTDTSGLSHTADKIEEKSSRPGSRFSSSSSGAVGSVTQAHRQDSKDVPAHTEKHHSIPRSQQNEREKEKESEAGFVQPRTMSATVRSHGREESSRGGDDRKERDDNRIERRERRRSRSRSKSPARRRSSRDSRDRGDSLDRRRERGSRLGRRDDANSDARHRRSTSRSRDIGRGRRSRSKSRSPVRRAVRGSDRARSRSASTERDRSKRARPSDSDRRRADDEASNSKSKRESSDDSNSESDSDR